MQIKYERYMNDYFPSVTVFVRRNIAVIHRVNVNNGVLLRPKKRNQPLVYRNHFVYVCMGYIRFRVFIFSG